MADQILATEFPAIHSDSVIDKSVYATGLRMLWCHKGMMGSRTPKQTQAFLDDHERIFPGEKYNQAYALVDPISFQPLVPMLEHLQWTTLATDEMENVGVLDLAETKIVKIGKASRQKVRKNSFQHDFKDEQQKHFDDKEYSMIANFIESDYSRDDIIEMVKFNKSIIVAIDCDYCHFKKGKHRGNKRQRVVINKSGSSQRCYSEKLSECQTGVHNPIYFFDLPQEIRSIVERIDDTLIASASSSLSTVSTIVSKEDTEKMFTELALTPLSDVNLNERLNLTLGPIKDTDFGMTAELTENLYCPICNRNHDRPENIFLVTKDGKRMIQCKQNWGTIFPNPAVKISTNQMNVLFQHNVQIINNNYGQSTDLDVKFDTILTIFPDDDELNMLIFKSFNNHASDIGNVIYHLGKHRFGIFNPRFEENLDNNRYLLSFRNGVYDLKTGTFRKSSSLDYLTTTIDYELPKKVDKEIRDEINSFIDSIMPNDEEKQYLLKWLASCLSGFNKDEIFTILTGSGRNGKGVLCELMSVTMGDYGHCIQASMLTNERPSSSAPCVDLLNLKGKRWVCGSEPEKGVSINGGFVKFLTGNDKISGRFCHANSEISFNPQHSLVIQCNAIPTLDGEDDAIWDRGRIIDFVFKFVDNPKGPFEKKIDRHLKEKVKTWGPQFMLILLDYYKQYEKEDGLHPSTAVAAKVRSVRKDNDPLVEFLEEHYELTNNDEDYVLFADMLELYKRSVKNGLSRPKLSEAAKRFGVTRMGDHFGRTPTYRGSKGFAGIRFKK
ncbi:hypothetical protein BDK51DRAFT_37723 [Blyttiomyces helicus]|uniref:SF3 helicase domain-containing protein n=1 Tax=Blyttiomyces helicus TaxID=388810 RepID=A0A4P9WC34_9FUNG|nr:hypothetical protein BDK51DRAFT_37723 [Blyttiomyces helicus]|eukprot:RKO89862.1 hypothetical protein BDK51DRAFT_37723 [Blyttiomyces helicus]